LAREKEERKGSIGMTFTQERAEDGGVVRRSFELTVDGERVPAVIWAPEGAKGPRPLVLMGHGGSQHKKTPTLSARARRYAQAFGYATLAIDAPGHGDRISREEAVSLAREVGARVRGEAPAQVVDPERFRQMLRRSQLAVPEWKAALDMAQSFDFVGADGPVGYWGVSMGTAIGVPFVASEPRVTAAIFGLAGLREGASEMEAAANKITIPLMFIFQWQDAVAPRETGIALFDAFGSKDKTMHINPGGHMDIPNFEAGDWEAFWRRHLGAADAPARAERAVAAE
jgi:pimeloyl-ACP methyl ester carboxylesterase